VEIVVVGGGIVGTMHAWYAVRRGYRVTHLEREPAARGASVRNFGMVWVSGRAAGPELTLALRARELWEKVAHEAPGIGFRPSGSLTLVRHEAELAVLDEVANAPDAHRRGVQVLGPEQASLVNPGVRGDFLAALYCERDALVEPRAATAALRAVLVEAPHYTWLPGREVVGYDAYQVTDDHGTVHRGDLVVLATGAWHRGLLGSHTRAAPLRRVRLQMLQTEPSRRELTTAVADGDSLRYYPAYDTPGRAALPPQDELAREQGMQLLVAQRLDGSLTVGDTHEYTEPFGFDLDEEPYRHLVEVAQRLLGWRLPPVRRRWAGVYSQLAPGADGLYHRSEPAPGVVLVTGPGGRGMTCAPAIAQDTLAALGRPAPDDAVPAARAAAAVEAGTARISG